MATKTAGTATSSGLTAIQWQPAGMNTTDLATINELIHGVADVVNLKRSSWIENGLLFIPSRNPKSDGIPLVAGDWICVDSSTGWVIVIPAAVMTASTVFTHS